MGTTIYTKYYLSDDQVSELLAQGFPTKIKWYVQNLTTNQFVNYSSMLGIERVQGNQALNLTFPDGTFSPGMELKAGVGNWNVMDANGRHCQQTVFFYVDENEQAIPCKYKELPSQNGGVIPTMPENWVAPAPVAPATQQTTLTAPSAQYLCISDSVACAKNSFEIHSALDTCSDIEMEDPENPDCVCMFCKQHRNVYIKKE